MPTLEAVAAVHRNRFFDQVTSVVPIETLFDNAPSFIDGAGDEVDQPEDSRFVVFTVQPGISEQVEIGAAGRYRTVGRDVASVFAPLKIGDQAALQVVDAINVGFRSVIDTGVVFLTPDVEVVGVTADRKWWQTNITIPWRVDTIP